MSYKEDQWNNTMTDNTLGMEGYNLMKGQRKLTKDGLRNKEVTDVDVPDNDDDDDELIILITAMEAATQLYQLFTGLQTQELGTLTLTEA